MIHNIDWNSKHCIFHTNAIRILNNNQLPGKRNYICVQLQKYLFGTRGITSFKSYKKVFQIFWNQWKSITCGIWDSHSGCFGWLMSPAMLSCVIRKTVTTFRRKIVPSSSGKSSSRKGTFLGLLNSKSVGITFFWNTLVNI